NPIQIVDGEDVGYKLLVEPDEPKSSNANAKSFNGVIFPWCSNSEEIASKAFRVIDYPSTGLAYVFQRFQDKNIYWCPWNGGLPSMDDRQEVVPGPNSYIDLIIGSDGDLPSSPATVSGVASEGPSEGPTFTFEVDIPGQTSSDSQGLESTDGLTV